MMERPKHRLANAPTGPGVFFPQRAPDVPLPEPAKSKGLGDIVEAIAKPVAKALGLKCLDEEGQLKSGSPCAKRKAYLNKLYPGK